MAHMKRAAGESGDPERINTLLKELVDIAASDDELLDKLGDVERAIGRLPGITHCGIWLCEEGEAWMARNVESFRVRPDTGPLGKFIAGTENLFTTDDYLHDPRIDPLSPEARNLRTTLSGSASYTPGDTVPQAYVRIQSRDATLGVMLVCLHSGDVWRGEDEWWLRHVAGIVGHIIERERLLGHARRSQRDERVHEVLLLLLPIMSSSMPFRSKMEEVERVLREALPISSARIWLRKGESGYSATEPGAFTLAESTGPLGRFMLGDDNFFWTNDYFGDPRIDPECEEATRYKARVAEQDTYPAGQAVPQAYVRIVAHEHTLGVLVCAPKPGSGFSEADEWWLRHIAGMLALAIENERLSGRSGAS